MVVVGWVAAGPGCAARKAIWSLPKLLLPCQSGSIYTRLAPAPGASILGPTLACEWVLMHELSPRLNLPSKNDLENDFY